MNNTYLAVTRFNNKTWLENIKYREKNNINGCCYGTPVLLQENIAIGGIIYVLEMNNEENKITGIGLIRNHNRGDKKYHIYSDGNYNRFNYNSEYRISREEFKKYDKNLMKLLEFLVFKGYTHMKRGHGIQLVTEKKFNEIKYKITKIEIITIIKDLFLNKYIQGNKSNPSSQSESIKFD